VGADPALFPGAGSGGDPAGRTPRWQLRMGRSVSDVLGEFGFELRSVRADLRVVGQPVEALLARKVLFAVGAAACPPVTLVLMALGGVRVPLLLPAWVSLALAVAGFFVPDMILRAEAAHRRRGFRHAVSSYLDLVAITLAGGTGTEGALHGAANVGQGWAFARIREALSHARDAGEPPWAALGRLGVDLDVSELRELAASLELAGNEGAKVRQSLAAKAVSLRRHEMADAESQAAEATERMVLPLSLLFVGFLIFLGYPAVTRVLFGL
jgi:Flp pilus assembly protein TadB